MKVAMYLFNLTTVIFERLYISVLIGLPELMKIGDGSFQKLDNKQSWKPACKPQVINEPYCNWPECSQ
jgi:hypothetical protein